MKLLCLLPVRNGAADLPLYLESVASFADGVLALDDGSTDSTGALLRSHPLVKQVITNPVRESYVGWSDVDNRRRLLHAAESLSPDWIIWIDADEILEPSDAAVLREFLRREGRPGVAYCVEILRMIDDLRTFDKCAMWIPRFYAFEKGYTLPDHRLHFELVPEQFDPAARCRTSFRILHRAGLCEERRQARYRKYQECDSRREWQSSYENLLDPPGRLKMLQPREPGDPVILPMQ